MAFWSRFMGSDMNSPVSLIKELTRTEKGEQAIMHLVADLVKDGVAGDAEREGMEEALQSFSDVISIDLLSHQVINKGKLSDQKTVINFREQARDKLAYWLANRIDQLCFLTASGIDYSYKLDGSLRGDPTFSSLAFAADVTPPTANRHVRVNGSTLDSGNTAAITPTDTLTYGHIVDIVTHASTTYLKPLVSNGKEYYIAVLRPEALAQLKKDPDYQRAITQAGPRDVERNPWFTGGTVTIDGLVIHSHRLVYNTKGASTGSKWGGAGDVDGARMLVLGAQALGFVDLSPPEWVEKKFNYDTRAGISVDKMFGLLKPKFHNIYTGSVEDFGVMVVDHAI